MNSEAFVRALIVFFFQNHFFSSGFFSRELTIHKTGREGKQPSSFPSPNSTRSQKLRNLFIWSNHPTFLIAVHVITILLSINFIPHWEFVPIVIYILCLIGRQSVFRRFFCFSVLKKNRKINVNDDTVWKVSKYGVFSGPRFPVFGLNTEIYSVFGHFSSSVRLSKRNSSEEYDMKLTRESNLQKSLIIKIGSYRLVVLIQHCTKNEVFH